MNATQKLILRKKFLEIRNNISTEFQTECFQKINEKIKILTIYQKSKHVALYYPFKNEVNLLTLFKETDYDKFFYFPALNLDNTLSFLQALPSTTFIRNQFGIQEPDIERQQAVAFDTLDIIFVPLLAFDPSGTRLGMGKGYYDRTLPKCTKAQIIGVAYECQRYVKLPSDEWDVKLDLIITEKKIYRNFIL